MKTQSSSVTLPINLSRPIRVSVALERRNVVRILVFVGLFLTLGPLTVFAKRHFEPEWQRSLLLPPPNEPPPPPPPSGDLLINYDVSAELPEEEICNSSAEAECANVLELPRSVFLQRHRILAVNHETGANGHLKHNRRREYYERRSRQRLSPEDELPMGEERDLKLPPADVHPPICRTAVSFR
jgi:hypothetical protein